MLKNLAKKISLITAIFMVFQMASIGLGVGVQGALAATPFDGAVTSFTLVNAATDTNIMSLPSGTKINMADTTIGHNLNIVANTLPSIVGSVKFVLTGAESYNHKGDTAPYALKGDSPTGNFISWTPTVGDYVLTATPYELINYGGVVGIPSTVTFSVFDDITQPLVTSVFGPKYLLNENAVLNNNPTEFLVRYDENMNTSIKPILTATPEISSSAVCSGDWKSLRNFQFTCNLFDANVEVPSVNVIVDGAQDLAGNIQVPFVQNDIIQVDTKAPILSFSPANGSSVKNQPINITATVNEATQASLMQSDFVATSGVINNFVVNGTIYTFTITPTTEGDITVKVSAGVYQDVAGNQNAADQYVLTYDTSAPAPVSGLSVTINSGGLPVVTWTNPALGSFAGLKIYRDGAYLMTLDPTVTSFTDTTAVPGTTYNYEVVTFDSAGNETSSLPSRIVVPKIELPKTAAVLIASAAISDSEQISSGGAETSKEVKANVDLNKKDDNKNDDSSGLPAWGLFLLLLLAIIGGYLFYTQKPNSQKTNAIPTTPKSTNTKPKSQTSKPRSTPRKK